MAIVKLDISEYELMKKNAKLLEESLAREKELSNKNAVLQQDNIDALKANEKTVTVVKRQHHRTVVSTRQSAEDIRQYLRIKMAKVVTEIVNSMERRGSNYSSRIQDEMMMRRGHFHHPRDMSGLMDYIMEQIQLRPEELHGIFYKEDTIKTHDDEEEVTRIGLDDVKAEISKELFEQLSRESKNAINQNPTLIKDAREAKDKVSGLKKDIKASKTLNKSKDKTIERLKDNYDSIILESEDNSLKINAIKLVMSGVFSIFGHKRKLRNVQEILDKKYEREERFL